MLDSAQIAEIQDRYRARGRDWLELEPRYEGKGRAVFSSNPGKIRGPTSVLYREDGTAERFEMTVAELLADQHPGEDANAAFFFLCGKPNPDEPGSLSFGAYHNHCDEVTVSDETFALRAVDPLTSATNSQVNFRPTRATVQFPCEAEPYYWVAPLLNFVSSFVLSTTELHGHPLRIRETAPYEPANGEYAYWHEHSYRQMNALIPFVCGGEPGFIEPLLDYDERRLKVEAGETLVTAVMVGRAAPGANAAEGDEWFPPDLVTLLGLATGRGVGVPFVELRGPSGELVRRMHAKISTPATRRGSPLIDEQVDRSTGQLLSAFLSSQHRDRPWLRVALRHLLRTFTGDMTIEDHLGYLFRATEGLAAGLKLNKKRPLELSTDTLERVTRALADTMAQLDNASADAGEADQRRIDGLKSRIGEVQANRPSFPTQLLGLVEHAGLPDAQWLREFKFRTEINGPLVAWSSAAGQYRNRIFHSGFIDFETYDVDNAVAFIGHLSDVLIRIVFHLLGFQSRYRAPCGAHGMALHETPDWPTRLTLSGELLRYVD
jgi:hypothetical protein